MTQTELSQVVNLSAAQCSRRLDRLRSEGLIQNVVAILNPEKLGFSVVARMTLVSSASAKSRRSSMKSTRQRIGADVVDGIVAELKEVRGK